MKITLRKANALQAAINDAVKALNLDTLVTLNEFEDVNEQIQKTRDLFWTNCNSRNDLVMALYDVRAKVAQANAAAGINDMLANVAYVEKQVSFNNMLAGKGTQTALRVLNGQVQKNANAKDDGFGYRHNPVTTSIFTEEEVEEFRKNVANHKRTKQKLQDALLELNVQTEIELSEETVAVLKKADIL
jgi:hypothetical protein